MSSCKKLYQVAKRFQPFAEALALTEQDEAQHECIEIEYDLRMALAEYEAEHGVP